MQLVVPGGVWVRDHDTGHADMGDLADRAGAAPAHHHVGCRIGVVHAIDVRDGAGDRVAGGAGDGVIELAGAGLDQQHDVVAVLPLIGQIEGGGRQAVRTEAPAAEHDELLLRLQPEGLACRLASAVRSMSATSGSSGMPTVRTSARLGRCWRAALERDRDVRCQPGDEGVGSARDRVALVDQ